MCENANEKTNENVNENTNVEANENVDENANENENENEIINDNMEVGVSQVKRKVPITLLVSVFLALVSFTIAVLIFRDVFSFELKHAYTADSPLYWTVGRGILNGLTPYQDLYENKPIGIFLISALSFGLTGETIICNIFSCLAVVMIAVLPALVLLDKYRRVDYISGIRKTAAVLVVFSCSLFIAVYTEFRSGAFQVESIGAAFSVLFICLIIKLQGAKTKNARIILTVLASLALSCTVMLKEPFLLVSVFGALLFIKSLKDLRKNLLIPCIGGGLITIAGLAVGGVLVPYFSIYLRRMFETRLSGTKATEVKAIDFSRIFKDISKFNKWLLILLLVILLLALISVFCKKNNATVILFHVFKVAAAVIIAAFCVGVGRYYYFHHYIFAVPIYCALLICAGEVLFELRPKKPAVSVAVILIWGVVSALLIPSIGQPYAGDYTARYNALTAKAAYVDEMLDYYSEERYQFIGFNGEDVFIGTTKHSPQGPVFGQDSDNFQSADTWFSQNLLEQVDNSNIVIVKQFLSPAINDEIQKKLDEDFTETPGKKFNGSVPADFNFKVYFRKSEYQ